MTLPANPLGPPPSANNRTGIQQIGVVLSDAVAKNYTHSVGAYPLAVQIYTEDGEPVEQASVAVTNPSTSILRLTPALTGAHNFIVFIMWALPSQWANGVPAVNFV